MRTDILRKLRNERFSSLVRATIVKRPCFRVGILLAAALLSSGATPSVRETAGDLSPNCGFPRYCAYTGQALSDPFQWNPHSNPPAYGVPKTPNVGNLSRKYKDRNNRNRTYGFRDTSYLNGSFTDVSNIPYVYRCTDAYTEPGRDPAGPAAQTFSPAIGNSGAGIAWNANSTLLHLSTQNGSSYIIQHDASNFSCADRPLLWNGNARHPGGWAFAQEFGSGGFSFTDPSIWNKKRPGGTIVQYQINWTKFWQPGMNVNVGDVVAAVAGDQRTSCFYRAKSAGVTGASQPSFLVSNCGGENYRDGTTTWIGLENRLKFCPDERHPDGAAVAPGQWCRVDDARGQPVVVADFNRALPITTENAPPWQPNHIYHFGEYVSFALSGNQLGSTVPASACQASKSESSCGWQAETRYNSGDLIRVGRCAYKVISVIGQRRPDMSTDGGITGRSKPGFPDGNSSSCDMQTYPEHAGAGNSVVWRGLGGPPRFAFQLISSTPASGSLSGSEFPGSYTVCRGWPRDIGKCEAEAGHQSDAFVTTHPDFMSFASDNGLVWANVGSFMAPSAWTYSSAISTSVDSRRYGEALSTNTYGSLLAKMPYGGLGETAGQQGTGIWAVVYDDSANSYLLYNTATGIISKWSCVGGSGSECDGGKLHYFTVGQVGVSCREAIHSFSLGLSGRYAVVSISDYTANEPCQFVDAKSDRQNALDLNWDLETDPSSDPDWAANVVTLGVIQHIATGDRYHASNMSVPAEGTYGGLESISDPRVDLPTWIVEPCETTAKWLESATTNPPCYSGWFDMHVGWADNADGTDDVPACGSHTGYSSNGMNIAIGIPYTSAFANEAICFPTRTDANSPKRAWRLSHTFHSQSNRDFDTRFAVSSVSQDGRFFAWSSDWTDPNGTGTLGSTSGQASCRGGYPWRTKQYYPAGAYVAPNGGMKGIDNLYGVFQAQNSGTSGRPSVYASSDGQPPWSGVQAGSTLVDNGIAWKKLGPGNCRGDVFIANISRPTAVASLRSDKTIHTLAKVSSDHPLTLTLRNRGTLPLIIASMVVKDRNGQSSKDFVMTSDCGSVLEPGYEGPLSGQKCTIQISAAPAVTSRSEASLTIFDNGTDSPQTVALVACANCRKEPGR